MSSSLLNAEVRVLLNGVLTHNSEPTCQTCLLGMMSRDKPYKACLASVCYLGWPVKAFGTCSKLR